MKQHKVDWPTVLHIIVAGLVFSAACAYAGLGLLLSGIPGGGGLWGVGPTAPDYIPLVGLIVGIYIFARGAMGKSNRAYMWLATVIVVASVYISFTISLSLL